MFADAARAVGTVVLRRFDDDAFHLHRRVDGCGDALGAELLPSHASYCLLIFLLANESGYLQTNIRFGETCRQMLLRMCRLYLGPNGTSPKKRMDVNPASRKTARQPSGS